MTLPRLRLPKLFSPPPYEGADVRLIKDDWQSTAECHLRDVVRRLEGELAAAKGRTVGES